MEPRFFASSWTGRKSRAEASSLGRPLFTSNQAYNSMEEEEGEDGIPPFRIVGCNEVIGNGAIEAVARVQLFRAEGRGRIKRFTSN